jgi:hypothetical protein
VIVLSVFIVGGMLKFLRDLKAAMRFLLSAVLDRGDFKRLAVSFISLYSIGGVS